jgi:antitoxin FitA
MMEVTVASITIRNLDDETKRRLRIRAAHQNRSMEEEARTILKAALESDSQQVHIVHKIRELFAGENSVDLPLPPRDHSVREIDFGE